MTQHTTITVPEIAERLGICKETIYAMLRNHEIPNLRHGHRFIVSRAAYEHWEGTIGEGAQSSLSQMRADANPPETPGSSHSRMLRPAA